MDKNSGQTRSLPELRQEVAHSRDRLARDIEGLRYELDFPLKFRKSFQRQTVFWVAAAIVLGLAAAVMPARTKKVHIRGQQKNNRRDEILGAGLALSALRVGLTLFRPAITKFISRKVSDYASGNGIHRRR